MKLTKYKIGDLIELITEINDKGIYKKKDVKGMTIYKEIIPTKADVTNSDLSKYIVIKPKEFVFNPRTHGKKIGLGYNEIDKPFIISWNNIGFRIKDNAKKIIIPEYLFMNFKREEWDREACFQSWGSSTEVFSWNTLCDMEMELPGIEIQQKYVNIYKAMVENQKSYERGLEDLKLICDSYIENLRKTYPLQKLNGKIFRYDEKNKDNKYDIKSVRGISVKKTFIDTKADMNGVSLKSYLIVKPDSFAYVTVTSRNSEKITIAHNDTGDTYIVSSSYVVFQTNPEILIPEYLSLFFNRSEFDRYARFNSWGSARETFTWDDLNDVEIPIPDVKIQKFISNIYKVLKERLKISKEMDKQLKNICSILIKGSLDEAKTD